MESYTAEGPAESGMPGVLHLPKADPKPESGMTVANNDRLCMRAPPDVPVHRVQ